MDLPDLLGVVQDNRDRLAAARPVVLFFAELLVHLFVEPLGFCLVLLFQFLRQCIQLFTGKSNTKLPNRFTTYPLNGSKPTIIL